MVDTVVEVEDLLKTGLGRLVFTLNLWVKDVALVHEWNSNTGDGVHIFSRHPPVFSKS